MRSVKRLTWLLISTLAAIGVVGLSMLATNAATADDLPSYLAPGKQEAAPATRLTARDVTARLFEAAPGSHPDLKQLDLTRLDLAELDFKAADLTGADLYAADLSRANLNGAALVGARLDNATITATDFSGADLTEALILRPTVFTTLEVATAEAPRFVGAKLVRFRSDGQLDRADFSGADLTGAVLGRSAVREPSVNAPASLTSTNFTRAVLKDAKLTGTNLTYARFTDADLRGANLIGTNLTQVDFSGADVTGADFTGANLDEANLRGARGLDQAIGLASVLNLDRARRDPVR